MFSRKAVLKQLDTSDDEHEDSVLSSDSEEEEEDSLSPPQQTVRTSTPFLPRTGLKRKLNYQPESTTKSLVTRKDALQNVAKKRYSMGYRSTEENGKIR